MDGERPGRRAGRRILRHTVGRRKHSRLPALAGPGRAVEADHVRQAREAVEIGSQRGHLVLVTEDDVDVSHPVVVQLDRGLRRLDPEGVEQLRLVDGAWLDAWYGLLHAAEHDLCALALEPHGDHAGARLEPDLLELHRAGEDERGAEYRVSGEPQLRRGREDAELCVPSGFSRVDEHRLRERHFARERLEHFLRDLPGISEDGELVARERPVREDVADDVPEQGHVS